MIVASKTLMALEGLILAYLSFLGMLLVLGGSIPFLSGSITSGHLVDFATSVMVAVFLVSGWRIYFWVLLGKYGTRSHINKYWFILSGLAVIFTVLSWPMYKLAEPKNAANVWYMGSQIFMLGLYFLPTAAHLLLHFHIEKIANKSKHADAVSGAGV